MTEPSEDRGADGTLAGASGQALDKFLQKQKGKVKQQTVPLQASAAASSLFPQPSSRFEVQDGACGAPAGILDDEGAQEPAKAAGRSRVEDTPAQPVIWPTAEVAENDGEDEEWEGASEFEEVLRDESLGAGPNGLVISLENEDEQEEGKPKGRHKFTREELLMAAMVHQTHILTLLARGQMYDLAAADPIVQAAALSIVPANELNELQKRAGALAATQLTSLVDWFQHNFKQTDEDSSALPQMQEQAGKESGPVRAGQQLQKVAANKCGTPEELVALFVAALRAAGLLVRYVRALDPLPWRPSVRERHVPQQRRPAKRKANAAEESSSTPKKRSRGTSTSGGKGGGLGRGRGRRIKTEDTDKQPDVPSHASATASEADDEFSPAGKGQNYDSNRRKRRKQAGTAKSGVAPQPTTAPTKGAKAVAADDDAFAELSDAELQARKGLQKGKGDLEFENQIAMAVLASAALKSKEGNYSAGEPQASNVAAGKAATKASLDAKPTLGAAWARRGQRSQAADTWAEVYCAAEDDSQGRWIHVQPLLGWIDKPELVESGSVRHAQLAYVVAFSGGGAKDVTSRYVSNLRLYEKFRKPFVKWWANTMRPLRFAESRATTAHLAEHTATAAELAAAELAATTTAPKVARDSSSNGMAAIAGGIQAAQKPAKRLKTEAKARAKREDEELKQKMEKQQLEVPTTLDGFRNHKHFILQRHVPRYSAIRPGAVKAGLHRGEPYYNTKDVSELHTTEKWVQLGFEVTPAEIGSPFKVVAKRGSKKAQNAASKDAGETAQEEAEGAKEDSADSSLETKLYGKWQTATWRPPVAKNGIVPRNDRGHVHCPPFAAALPQGTTIINRPRVAGICRRLGVDYAMAMTGFDIRGGRSVPCFEGVVVCSEFAAEVEQEWFKEQSAIAEREAVKQMENARATWAALLRAIFTRLGLQDDRSPKPSPKKAPRAGGSGNPEKTATKGSPETAAGASRSKDREEEEQAANGRGRAKVPSAARRKKRGKAEAESAGTEQEAAAEAEEFRQRTRTGIAADFEEI